MEKEIQELKLRQKLIGEAVKIAVDSLLLDEKRDELTDSIDDIRRRKREALESLAYARDILLGNSNTIEEEQLFGETEYKRRIATRKVLQSTQNTTKGEAIPSRVSAPQPAALFSGGYNESHSQPRSVTESPHPLTSLPRTATKTTSRPFVTTTGKSPSSLESPRPIGPAPWNSTRSNFAASAIESPNLPQIPPPASATLPNNLQHSRSKSAHSGSAPRRRAPSYDPLGALP